MLEKADIEKALASDEIKAKLTPEQKKFLQVKKRKQAAISRAIDAMAEHKKTCDHFLVHDSDYFSGSYYDKAYTTHYHLCLLCGKREEVSETNHSWYG